MMEMYIRATGNISPQSTFGHVPFLTEPVEYFTNRLTCIEPDYKNFIDAKMIRRMSRIIKMGVAAASECLQEANIKIPDAIITGTAYGCLEDTGVFLTKMVEQKEEMLTPTAFIQSTHNTVGAQVALILHCHNYNNTFVHRGFSFESALLDAMMLLDENEAKNILVGSVDEITNISHAVINRFGLYKQNSLSNFELFLSNTKGTIAGEGAAFFLLSSQQSENNYAQLDALTTFYKPASINEVKNQVSAFLNLHSVSVNNIDLIITGKNGDINDDKIYEEANESVFKNKPSINYKHLCGEYPTATGFALWLAANIIKTNTIPSIAGNVLSNNKLKKILIYNHYQNIHHSLFLISAC
jgi:3-oxoacyl-[acyl-carrier-protein] synthase II